jgi:hypothetical protein
MIVYLSEISLYCSLTLNFVPNMLPYYVYLYYTFSNSIMTKLGLGFPPPVQFGFPFLT